MTAPDTNAWLDAVRDRLVAKRYRITDDVSFEGSILRRVAHKSGFQWAKFGNAETFFVFGEPAGTDPASIRRFSATAFRYAKASKRFPLPCGLFEVVTCFAVAMVDRLDDASAEAVRTTTPDKHWAAFEMPVVYDRSRGALACFEKTPTWGAAYYAGFRKQVAELLGPATAP